MKKLIRITTVPISLEKLLENQLKFMKDYYEVIAVSSDKDRLTSFGQDQGVRVYEVNLTRKITPFKDIIAVIKLYSFLRKEKPFIVHTHTPKAGLVGMLASYFAGVPNRLHTVAGLPLLETRGIKRKVLNFVESFTYSCATKVYPNSYGLKEIIVDNKFAKEGKLKIIGNGSSNGIDVTHFNPCLYTDKFKNNFRKNLKIDDEDFVFIFVGRIVSDKGINELVKAFDALSKKDTQVKLILVGPLEEDLDPLDQQTVNMIGTNKGIISVGYQKDVRPYFAISDVLTFPSYREGFPNVVMQAGAMGLPSIVSNINGCNEIITTNINGSIIDVKDEVSLEKEMKRYMDSEELLKKEKFNCRDIIVKNYQREFVWKELLKEYKKLENV